MLLLVAAAAATAHAQQHAAADDAAKQRVELAGGRFVAAAPGAWQVVEPKMQMIEKEFSIPAPQGADAEAARLTVMTAGGSVEQNIARWIGQFQGTEGGADRSQADTEQLEVDGMKATVVDISGVYLQSAGGPFGPKTPREGWRMLGAIVETGGAGNYFFKMVGPEQVVGPAAHGFKQMISSLEKKP
ncbi:hypothetical protein [Botrimarina sp.]|uniref:hypothetical protein n=1 Tax=Botrimarina sp. TaxID=2795802 RepID=UPI0032EC4DAB